MSEEILDFGLVRSLQARVADEITVIKQNRLLDGDRELAQEDERQMALSLMQAQVSRYMQDRLRRGMELPDPSYDQRLVEAIDAAMYRAGELQALLDDDLVENIDINGADEV